MFFHPIQEGDFTRLVERAEEGGFHSYCPELGVASQGESVKEAKDNLSEAIIALLNGLREIGGLGRFLWERGLGPQPESRNEGEKRG